MQGQFDQFTGIDIGVGDDGDLDIVFNPIEDVPDNGGFPGADITGEEDKPRLCPTEVLTTTRLLGMLAHHSSRRPRNTHIYPMEVLKHMTTRLLINWSGA